MSFCFKVETDNQLNFLDLNIEKKNIKFEYIIYRKLIFTDTIIHAELVHSRNHKLAANRYLVKYMYARRTPKNLTKPFIFNIQ